MVLWIIHTPLCVPADTSGASLRGNVWTAAAMTKIPTRCLMLVRCGAVIAWIKTRVSHVIQKLYCIAQSFAHSLKMIVLSSCSKWSTPLNFANLTLKNKPNILQGFNALWWDEEVTTKYILSSVLITRLMMLYFRFDKFLTYCRPWSWWYVIISKLIEEDRIKL